MPRKATITKESEVHTEAAHTIHTRAQQELSSLEQRLQEIGKEAETAQTELAEIEPARQKRQADLTAARNALRRATDEERRAEKLAKYSIGTSRETASAKGLANAQMTFVEAEKALKALEPTTQEAERNAQKREAELIKQLGELADEKTAIADEIQHTKQMHEQTHRELGEQKYASIVKIDNEQHKGPIDEMKSQIVKRLVERQKFLEQAKGELEQGGYWNLSNRLEQEVIDPDDDEDDFD